MASMSATPDLALLRAGAGTTRSGNRDEEVLSKRMDRVLVMRIPGLPLDQQPRPLRVEAPHADSLFTVFDDVLEPLPEGKVIDLDEIKEPLVFDGDTTEAWWVKGMTADDFIDMVLSLDAAVIPEAAPTKMHELLDRVARGEHKMEYARVYPTRPLAFGAQYGKKTGFHPGVLPLLLRLEPAFLDPQEGRKHASVLELAKAVVGCTENGFERKQVTGAQIQHISQTFHEATETRGTTCAQGPVVLCADADKAADMMRPALALAAPLKSGRDLTSGQRAASKLCIQSALTFMRAQLKKQGDANQDIGTGM